MDQKDLKQIEDVIDRRFDELEKKIFEWKSEIINHIKKVTEDLARDRIERKIRREKI